MKRICLFFSLLLVASIFAACSNSKGPGSYSKPAEGKPAVSINVISMNDQQVSLDSLKGKVVFLHFWSTTCPPCRLEIPHIMKLEKKMQGKPFQLICISVGPGGKEEVRTFFKNTGFSMPTYFDPTGESAKIYGVTGVPETFLIDKNGVIVKKVIGALDWSTPEAVAFIENLAK